MTDGYALKAEKYKNEYLRPVPGASTVSRQAMRHSHNPQRHSAAELKLTATDS